MRTFPNFNTSTFCPICGTNEDKPCVLIPIDGTDDKEEKICQAMQVHADCVDLRVKKGFGDHDGEMLIYQLTEEKLTTEIPRIVRPTPKEGG